MLDGGPPVEILLCLLSNLVPHLLSTEKGIFSIALRPTRLANTTRFASFQVGSLYTYFVPHLMQSI